MKYDFFSNWIAKHGNTYYWAYTTACLILSASWLTAAAFLWLNNPFWGKLTAINMVLSILVLSLDKYLLPRLFRLPMGTKSVLFGAHCFFIHPWFVAAAWWKLYGFPFDPRLWVRWHDFTLYHSRFLAKRYGRQYSKLCVADKLGLAITPAWLYLPMCSATGELEYYMELAKTRYSGKSGQGYHADPKIWHGEMVKYLHMWVGEYKELKIDLHT